MAHLIAHGHRRIAYIGDTPAIPTSGARLRGYRDALARHQVEADENLVNTTSPTSQAAAEAVSALLGGSRPPTAILSATTRASLGVVPALHSAGRTDIGLVSFGDFPMADALRPAVTVVDHPGHEVGRVAAARLLARLDQPGLPVERIGVPARLIERGSGELTPCPGPVHDREHRLVVGLDIGTTSSKAVIGWPRPCPYPAPGARKRAARVPVCAPVAEQSTPWQAGACGQAEIHPNRLVSLAVDLIGTAVRAAEQPRARSGCALSA